MNMHFFASASPKHLPTPLGSVLYITYFYFMVSAGCCALFGDNTDGVGAGDFAVTAIKITLEQINFAIFVWLTFKKPFRLGLLP